MFDGTGKHTAARAFVVAAEGEQFLINYTLKSVVTKLDIYGRPLGEEHDRLPRDSLFQLLIRHVPEEVEEALMEESPDDPWPPKVLEVAKVACSVPLARSLVNNVCNC